MLVSDIVVLTLDRDLSGFTRILPATNFISNVRAAKLFFFFSLEETEKASKRRCIQFLYYNVGSYVGKFPPPPAVHC